MLDVHGLPKDVLASWAKAEVEAPGVVRRFLLGSPRQVPPGVERVTTLAELANGTVHDLMIYGAVERTPDLVALWHAVYRVLAPAATVRVYGAYWLHADCVSDPTRIRGLSERMFTYLSKAGRTGLRGDQYEDDAALDALEPIDLEVISMVHLGEPEWNGRSEEARNWAVRHYNNVVRRLDVILRKP